MVGWLWICVVFHPYIRLWIWRTKHERYHQQSSKRWLLGFLLVYYIILYIYTHYIWQFQVEPPIQMKLTEYPHFAGSITISFRWFHPESYNGGAPWWQRHLTVHPIWTDPNQWTLRQLRDPMRSRYVQWSTSFCYFCYIPNQINGIHTTP